MTQLNFIKSLLVILSVFCIYNTSAQKYTGIPRKYDFTVTMGAFTPTAKPDVSSFELPVAFGLELMRRFPFASKHAGMQVGLGVQQYAAVTDHYFNAGDFVPLPSGTNYNRMSQTHLQVPVMFETMPMQSGKGGIAIRAGLVPGVFLGGNNHLRAEGNTRKQKIEVDNNVQLSGRFEFGSTALSSSPSPFVWGAGVQYQFTNYVKDDRSFRPLTAYFRVGISF